MKALLDRAGIRYQEQKHFRGIGIADFYLTDYQIAIEVDGGWWHSLPANRLNDERKDAGYKDQGIYVIRFSDTEVLSMLRDGL